MTVSIVSWTPVDKMGSFDMNNRLQGYLLLGEADLAYHDKNIVIEAVSGRYDVDNKSLALRIIY